MSKVRPVPLWIAEFINGRNCTKSNAVSVACAKSRWRDVKKRGLREVICALIRGAKGFTISLPSRGCRMPETRIRQSAQQCRKMPAQV